MPPNENTIEAGQMFNFSKLNLSPNRSISRRGQLFRWLRVSRLVVSNISNA